MIAGQLLQRRHEPSYNQVGSRPGRDGNPKNTWSSYGATPPRLFVALHSAARGASNYSAERLEEALATSRANNLPAYVSLQPHYNLMERPSFEDALEAACLQHQLGVIPYYSLASGFLTGKYRSKADLAKSAARGGSVAKYLNGKGPTVLSALDEVAAATAATPTQVALASLMARPGITAPIASASTPEQVGDLVKPRR